MGVIEQYSPAMWRRRCACGHLWLLHEADDLPEERPTCGGCPRRGVSMCERPPVGWVLP